MFLLINFLLSLTSSNNFLCYLVHASQTRLEPLVMKKKGDIRIVGIDAGYRIPVARKG